MSASPTGQPPVSATEWPRVLVHPGRGVVDRRADTLLVVPVLPVSRHDRVREVFELCLRRDLAGSARVDALQALLRRQPPAELPGFALLVRTGGSLHALVHGPVGVLVDGRTLGKPGAGGGRGLDEHVLEDGAWHQVTVAADGDTAERERALLDLADVLPLDLGGGTVPGAGVTLLRVPRERAQQPPARETTATAAATGRAASLTAIRPTVQFRTVLLGECAVRASGRQPVPGRRPPLPVAGVRGEDVVGTGATESAVLVEGVRCPGGHFTDPDMPTCPRCGAPLSPGERRVTLPRPPLGILVTDGGTIYTVDGDFLIGREAGEAPDVLAGRARAVHLRDAARSTSRVHARLTVMGWKVRLSDNGSANGTFVSGHGAAGPWLPVAPHTSVTLAHGDRVRLGDRQLLFDTWRETVVPQVFR
jgi:hypothetical protein